MRISTDLDMFDEILVDSPLLFRLTKTLSGGNKRKLSLAIAMAWGSKIILLDEPSSGMDPLARRQLWHEIRYVKNNNTCVLLTTHSMDEAEAICDRIGKFFCH